MGDLASFPHLSASLRRILDIFPKALSIRLIQYIEEKLVSRQDATYPQTAYVVFF